MTAIFRLLPTPPAMPAFLLHSLPRLASGANRLVPFGLQQRAILFFLRHVFAELLRSGELEFLDGRQLQIHISDADLQFTLGMKQGRLTLSQAAHADTAIRGRFQDFILLASRQEDPDTLFFQRRLLIEGDTDLGHEMKNVLDTLDRDVLPAQVNAALEWLARQYRQH